MPLGEKKQTQKRRKAIFGFFLIAFVFLFFSSVGIASAFTPSPTAQIELSLEKAEAACVKAGGITPLLCPQEALAKVAKTTSDEVIKPTWEVIGITALLNLTTFIFDRIAYEGAVFIVSGGKGQTPLFEARSAEDVWNTIGLDIAGEAVGALSEGINKMSDSEFGKKFNLCKPSVNLSFSLALGIQQTYKPRAPKCDLTKFSIEGFEGLKRFYASDDSGLSTSNMMREVAGFMRPGQNELSLAVDLNSKVLDKVMATNKAKFAEFTESGGFKKVTDSITGKTQKPADYVKEKYKEAVVSNVQNRDNMQLNTLRNVDWGDVGWSLLSEVGGIFANTLLSKGVERLTKELLSAAAPDLDPFASFESSNQPGRAEAVQRLSKITAINPISPTNYNALGEFSVCPVGNIMSRGPNNCVIDSNFIQALTNTQSDVPITLQQALKDGKIKDLPLISDQDKARNQDPLCYTYGYCYGNLVKLRKARIIPVGWEMAAQQNSVDNPAKLSDIMKRFDNCNPTTGEWENTDNYRFCHLIDPNWVLKYPESQCRAMVNGELLATTSGGGRAVVCADTPSCVAEDDKGECTGGFGYCVKEKNVWRFRGDACPEQFASCLSFRNTFNGKTGNWLLNTVDYSVCGKDNAGCRWYKTKKEKSVDGSYQWTASALPVSSAVGVVKDRIYFNNDVKQCGASDAGCTKVIPATTARLNLIANPSFEKVTPDGKLEFWSGAVLVINTTGSAHGSKDVVSNSLEQGPILLSPNAFYTLSFYARMGEGSVTNDPEEQGIAISFTSFLDGIRVGLGGTSISSSCRIVDQENVRLNDYIFIPTRSVSQEFQRYACTFTTLGKSLNANISFYPGDGELRFDAIQLEAGESASAFTEGYGNTTPKGTYLRLPPEYLKCDGTETQPKECKNFTQACQAQDVGCNLYTPDDGDPEIPAVISVTDRCPAACVGYATYKQEPSFYEKPTTPVYANFIATRATSCQQQNVGCDGFTNLDTVARGGEGKETYTYLRACTKPNDPNTHEAVFYTWEGNDQQGYQLKTWRLLKSNAATSVDYVDVADDTKADSAPCTKWRMDSATVLKCADDLSDLTYLSKDSSCNEHDDVLNSADGDCREFYDADGNIHYRRFLQTVTVSESCQPYRKNASAKDDCEFTGGKWNIATGECRYLGLSSESYQCPSAADGCRAYTGGAGRNSQTVYSHGFEPDETPMIVAADENAKPVVSSEAITAGKHSLRLEVSGQYLGFEQAHLKSSSVCDDEDGCDGGVGVGGCKIKKGKTTCGELDGKILPGKSYTVEFLAKATGGSGKIRVAMVDGANVKHDLVNAQNAGTNISSFATLSLEGGWRPFKLGPIETSAFVEQADSVGLRFVSAEGGPGQIFYFDEITIRQVDEHIAMVKNSWSVPTVCDQTPDGTVSPQYYLGCEAYTNKQGSRLSLYQFSRLCSEDVIGCQRFYDTRGSDSEDGNEYGKAFNVTCEQSTAATAVTPCKIDSGGQTYCTISPGKKSCQFNLPNNDIPQFLPAVFPISGNGFTFKLGPEAVLVSNDIPKYFVDNGTTTCAEEVAGCTEFGVPTYSQDKANVTAFASTYFINDVDTYAPEDGTPGTLCKDEELFCDEWSTTKNGNYYFKDPVDKACEYKTGVRVGDQTYYGWFKKGTSLACYANAIVAGERYDIKRNGDDLYEGWAGQCGAEANMCTGFVDPTDTQNGRQPFGKTYTFLDNDALRDATDDANATEPCEGLASQKAGCALFNNTSVSRLTFAAGPTYTLSNHADKLIDGGKLFMKVDPVDCAKPVAERSVKGVDLCARRCRYDVGINGAITDGETVEENITTSTNYEYGRSCYESADCPTLHDRAWHEVSGICIDISLKPTLVFANDANSVLKVNRDRTCAEWGSCTGGQTNWNSRTGREEKICQQVELCDTPGPIGDIYSCGGSAESVPEVLSVETYADRDLSWAGQEYSGYSIPSAFPFDQIDQAIIKTQAAASGGATTSSVYLAHTLGPCVETGACDSGFCANRPDKACTASTADVDCKIKGGECRVGVCEQGGNPCASKLNCSTGDKCVFGQCVQKSSVDCASTGDADADGNDEGCNNDFPFCRSGKCQKAPGAGCVNIKTSNSTECVSSGGDASEWSCVQSPTTAFGSCYDNKCFQDVRGGQLVLKEAEILTCRGYPESDSPFPALKVSKTWTPVTANLSPTAVPTVAPYGYETAKTCAPINCEGSGAAAKNCKPTNACECSYQKLSYGSGSKVLYYPTVGAGSDASWIPVGICASGDKEGKSCAMDADCKSGDVASPGSCVKQTRRDVLLGWDGFCLERDSSIQLYGSQDTSDRPCLTWLPVDQARGTTDLYGKIYEAGYQTDEDHYYCAEAAYYVDMYPTGTAFKPDGSLGEKIQYACAISSAESCDNETTGCEQSAFCPKGYVAIVAKCLVVEEEERTEGQFCEDDASTQNPWMANGVIFDDAADDCPYFCIPDGSRHSLKESADICVKVEANNTISGDILSFTPNSENNLDNRGPSPVVRVDSTGAGVKFTNILKDFRDCVLRGVPPSVNNEESWFYPNIRKNWVTDRTHLALSGWDTTSVDAAGEANVGFFGLIHNPVGVLSNKNVGSSQEYIGCYELAKTAKAGPVGEGNRYLNKAWTNRLLFSGTAFQTFVGGVVSRNNEFKDDSTVLDTKADSQPTKAGRALFQEYFAEGGSGNWYMKGWAAKDSWPLPVSSCERKTEKAGLCADVFFDLATAKEVRKECSNDSDCQICRRISDTNPEQICSDYGPCRIKVIGLEIVPESLESSMCMGGNKYQKYPTPSQYTTSELNSSILTEGESWSLARVYEDLDLGDEKKSFDEGFEDKKIYDLGSNDNGNHISFSNMLSQFFTRIVGEVLDFKWDETTNDKHGAYKLTVNERKDNFSVDFSLSGDAYGTADADKMAPIGKRAPTISAIGECKDGECLEGDTGAFTVNGKTNGVVSGKEYRHTQARFFVYANPNQLPLRNIVVDWGDGDWKANKVIRWPNDSYSGSKSDDNFYKNHRGFIKDNTGNYSEICARNSAWGETSDSCDPSYRSYEHDYRCSPVEMEQLQKSKRLCKVDMTTGKPRLINSPCTGSDDGKIPGGDEKCVFQPRVHTADNWGYCTGECPGGEAGSECYDASADLTNGEQKKNECNINACPGNKGCRSIDEGVFRKTDGQDEAEISRDLLDNPWINFNGFVVIEP